MPNKTLRHIEDTCSKCRVGPRTGLFYESFWV